MHRSNPGPGVVHECLSARLGFFLQALGLAQRHRQSGIASGPSMSLEVDHGDLKDGSSEGPSAATKLMGDVSLVLAFTYHMAGYLDEAITHYHAVRRPFVDVLVVSTSAV